ncbi:MAG: hypothetical protein LBR41_02105, partial [Rickettsiales bacterium]|nr:hypothetical protein [Rickettsiales bacterium]
MKKLLTMTLVLALAACGREYYRGDSRYIQYGDDCHYTFSQRGGNFRTSDESVKLDENKKIRYRD